MRQGGCGDKADTASTRLRVNITPLVPHHHHLHLHSDVRSCLRYALPPAVLLRLVNPAPRKLQRGGRRGEGRSGRRRIERKVLGEDRTEQLDPPPLDTSTSSRARSAAVRTHRATAPVVSFEVRQKAETPSILDFFIRFLSSRMRFKRNGSYTLNR